MKAIFTHLTRGKYEKYQMASKLRKKRETLLQKAWVGIPSALKSLGCEISSHLKQKKELQGKQEKGGAEGEKTPQKQNEDNLLIWCGSR